MNARLRLALLFIPVLLQLCFFRLAEFSLARGGAGNGYDESLGAIVLTSAPGFLLALILPLGLYALVRVLTPGIHPAVAALSGLAAVLLFFAGIPSAAALSPWLSPDALAFVVLDVLILASAGALMHAMLVLSGGGLHRAVVVLAHVLAAFASLLLTLNFGYFLKTGTSGDWLLFWYALQTIHETRDVIASEINWLEIGLLALPVFVAIGPLMVLGVRRLRTWTPPIDATARPYFWSVIVFLLVVLGSQSVVRDDVIRGRGSLFAGFVREAASVRQTPPASLLGAEPAFDARNLELVPGPDARQMNVVFVVLESIRADALTPYDRTLPTTPFLDSLASEGMLVEQMYAPVAHTTKALVPLLAGVYPTLQLQFPESRPGGFPARALPELLAPLGYRSAFFTPAPLAFENKEGLLRNMGFEVLRGDGSFDTEGFERIGYFGFEDRVVVKPAMQWVDETVRDGAPFFLSVLTLTTHHPYNPPSAYANRHYESRLPDGYLNAVASTDAFVRELYHEFARRSLLEETLFVIVADHGEAFREHGMTGHNQVLWDEVLHVPCVILNPSLIAKQQRVAGPRSQVDLLPTIAELLGLELRNGRLPGRSLLEESSDARAIYHSAWNNRQGLALRDATSKYHFFWDREPIKAFKTDVDPGERIDLAPSLPADLLREVEEELVAWRWSVEAAYSD